MVNTVEENKFPYTTRQFEQAKRARKLFQAIGSPSLPDFKAILSTNQIANCPVTLQDVKIAEKIFGPDIGSLKGKTTRTKPPPVVKDYIEIPDELTRAHHEAELCIDTFYINKMPFFSTVTKRIMYRTANWIQDLTHESYQAALLAVIWIYKKAGFKIVAIHCDQEFVSLLQGLEDHRLTRHIRIIPAAANSKVPEAERNVRVLKERFRASYHRIPYPDIPRTMIKFLVLECATKLNYFPPKGGISQVYSPRMILHHRTLDYKNCQHEFGAYVQAHEDPHPKNSQQPRTLDCIYLRPSATGHGHDVLNVYSGDVIS